MLKQQLRDSQAEVTQKLSEIFHLKTQLREARTVLSNRESQIETLKMAAHDIPRRRCFSQTGREDSSRIESAGNHAFICHLYKKCIHYYISIELLYTEDTTLFESRESMFKFSSQCLSLCIA